MTIGRAGALGRPSLERHVDAVRMQFALALDIAQTLGDETVVVHRSGKGQPSGDHPPIEGSGQSGQTPSIICRCDSSSSSAPARKSGRTVAVTTGQTISLGRLKGCDVVVDDEAASRRHCTISGREDACVVADLQSANGTFVNEKRIASVELQHGDKIRIGSTVIELID